MRQFLGLIKWLIILLAVFGLAFLIYAGVKINQPLLANAESKTFEVPKGSTAKQVADKLQTEGLINRPLFFELFLYLKNWDGKIQAGSYNLSASMPIREIAAVLVAGKALSNEIKFQLTEGFSVADVASGLEQSGILKKSDFLKLKPQDFADEFGFLNEQPKKFAGLEGYLFPDTYLFTAESSSRTAAEKMLRNFDRKLTDELRLEIDKQGKTVHEIITLASIIEREVGRNLRKGEKLSTDQIKKLAEERRLVAGVFSNRLEAGLALESDATISYLTGRRGSSRATLQELKIDSPYNTYKYPGLPPGPIANPSLDAILAAIHPAETNYLYFVTDSSGTAHFAKTLEGHKANRAKYLPPP